LQDSGFSDNEESHQLQHQLQQASPQSPQSDRQQTPTATPTSVQSVATPPTVVRRVGNSSFYSPLISVTRRISFTSGQITPKAKHGESEDAVDAELEASRSRLFEQLDSMKLDDEAVGAEEEDSPPRPAIRRRRRVMRKAKPEPEEASASEEEVVAVLPPPPPYNNETVYLGEAPP